MSLHLAPASTQNLAKSIDTPIDPNLLKEHLTPEDLAEINKRCGNDVYCWAVSEKMPGYFKSVEPGDLVLFAESKVGKFTRMARVAWTVSNSSLGDKLWPVSGASRWSNIYFLHSVQKINLDKKDVLNARLNYPETMPLSMPVKVNHEKLSAFETAHGVSFFNWLNVSAFDERTEDIDLEFHDRVTRQRTNQHKFRQLALDLYNGTCAISGCDVDAVLEAAHIMGVSDNNGTHAADNALLLRADLHTLFDQLYLYIEPDTLKARFHPAFFEHFSSAHSHYGHLDNADMLRPKTGNVSTSSLNKHKDLCFEAHGHIE